MQSIRKRMKASDFKEVENKEELTIIRWDPTPEIITVPLRKKDAEPIQKESGYVICTELVIFGKADKKKVKAAIDKDLELRYPEDKKPKISIKF